MGIAVPSDLRPGESRVLHTKPCPPHMYTRPHGYWYLRRVFKRFLENESEFIWGDDDYFEAAVRTMRKLRETAKLFPATPWTRWEEERLGEVFEVCCPNCRTIFTWEGHFYAPQCPGCKCWLHERREGQAS